MSEVLDSIRVSATRVDVALALLIAGMLLGIAACTSQTGGAATRVDVANVRSRHGQEQQADLK